MAADYAVRGPLGEAEPDIQSTLVDLSAVPLARLRVISGPMLERTLQQVVEQTNDPRPFNRGQCSQRGID